MGGKLVAQVTTWGYGVQPTATKRIVQKAPNFVYYTIFSIFKSRIYCFEFETWPGYTFPVIQE